MIKFSLSCDAAHAFEAWFRNSADFDTQSKRGFVSCPQCGSSRVAKTLMAPAVSTARGKEKIALAMNAQKAEVMAKMREMVREMKAGADDVGERFAEEARKIHFGETEERAIYGKASGEEVEALIDDGVPFMPLPDLPEERN